MEYRDIDGLVNFADTDILPSSDHEVYLVEVNERPPDLDYVLDPSSLRGRYMRPTASPKREAWRSFQSHV
jgi:hypothetical protein